MYFVTLLSKETTAHSSPFLIPTGNVLSKLVEALHPVNVMMYYSVRAIVEEVKSQVVKRGSNMSQWENWNHTCWCQTSIFSETKCVNHDFLKTNFT